MTEISEEKNLTNPRIPSAEELIRWLEAEAEDLLPPEGYLRDRFFRDLDWSVSLRARCYISLLKMSLRRTYKGEASEV